MFYELQYGLLFLYNCTLKNSLFFNSCLNFFVYAELIFIGVKIKFIITQADNILRLESVTKHPSRISRDDLLWHYQNLTQFYIKKLFFSDNLTGSDVRWEPYHFPSKCIHKRKVIITYYLSIVLVLTVLS